MSSEILNALTYFFLPVCIMFAAERWFLGYMRRTPERINQIRRRTWLHPNNISRCRYVMGVVCVLLYMYVSKELALLWFSFWMITDVSDGTIAKYFDLDTDVGKVIDPLSDKLFYFPPLFYAAYLDLIPLAPTLIFVVVDFLGQFSRMFVADKAANLFGKTKTLLAVLTLLFIYVQDTFFSSYDRELTVILIGGTVFLAFCSMIFRLIPNYWYANILSIMNLICGLTAIGAILLNYDPVFALILIFIGQFLDLFDGRAAEKWGSTPRGEIFDDLADGTSFGLAVSVLIAYATSYDTFGIVAALIYLFCAVYRLYRFIHDKKKVDPKKGVCVFNGMPTPAAALFVCSGILFIVHYRLSVGFMTPERFIYAVTGLASILMISHIPYIHFGRTILKKIPKIIQVLCYAVFIAMIGYNINYLNSMLLINTFLFLATMYVLFGIKHEPRQKKN